MLGRPGCDFSFSGLKTAVRHAAVQLPGDSLSQGDAADLAAAFQAAVGDVLVDRCGNALAAFTEAYRAAAPVLVVAGGVAANLHLRQRLGELCAERETRMIAPPPELCTDNAAMIAWAGIERLRRGATDGLDFAPRPRWPLEEIKAAVA